MHCRSDGADCGNIFYVWKYSPGGKILPTTFKFASLSFVNLCNEYGMINWHSCTFMKNYSLRLSTVCRLLLLFALSNTFRIMQHRSNFLKGHNKYWNVVLIFFALAVHSHTSQQFHCTCSTLSRITTVSLYSQYTFRYHNSFFVLAVHSQISQQFLCTRSTLSHITTVSVYSQYTLTYHKIFSVLAVHSHISQQFTIKLNVAAILWNQNPNLTFGKNVNLTNYPVDKSLLPRF
jgi:hypothetical protein